MLGKERFINSYLIIPRARDQAASSKSGRGRIPAGCKNSPPRLSTAFRHDLPFESYYNFSQSRPLQPTRSSYRRAISGLRRRGHMHTCHGTQHPPKKNLKRATPTYALSGKLLPRLFFCSCAIAPTSSLSAKEIVPRTVRQQLQPTKLHTSAARRASTLQMALPSPSARQTPSWRIFLSCTADLPL
jgi:hypothetical protein